MGSIRTDSVETVKTFLLNNFAAAPGYENWREGDFHNAAWVAKFLSDDAAFLAWARIVGAKLWAAYDLWKSVGRDQGYELRGAFSCALSMLAPAYGFSQHVLILNGPVANDVFNRVLAERHMFRDLLSRRHGEYAHALQWLTIAEHFGPAAAGLYSRLGSYTSIGKMRRNGKREIVTLWQWLADCFEGAENYETNLDARSMRCPQWIMEHAVPALNDEWIGRFLWTRRRKGLGVARDTNGHYKSNYDMVMSAEYARRKFVDIAGGVQRAYTEHWQGSQVLVKSVFELRRRYT